MVHQAVVPRPAASVVVLRQGAGGLELLFLRRNPKLAFQGNYWVFPGGRIDDEDADPTAAPDGAEEATARRAAVREAREEADLRLSASDLRYAAHWTTPAGSPIRYATWFFIAAAPDTPVRVDGGEIEEHRWLRPETALGRRHAGEIQLAAPTFALTTRLAAFDRVDGALAAVAGWPRVRLLAELREVEDGRVAVYAQDAAHGGGPLERPGPRHRLWMVASGWRYEEDY